MATGLALVTGASSGIGLSLAKELAVRGYNLVISSAGVRLDEAGQKLAGTGVLALPVQADLATRCEMLEALSTFWWTADAMARLGRKALKSLKETGIRRASATSR